MKIKPTFGNEWVERKEINGDKNYIPFGHEWVKEVCKMPIKTIRQFFDIEKLENETKLEYVKRIAEIKKLEK